MSRRKKTIQNKYLDIVRRLVVTAHKRQSLLSVELSCSTSIQPDKDATEQLMLLNRVINKASSEMRKLEAETEHSFGIQALLGDDAPVVLRVAVAVLIGKACTSAVTVYSVADLAELAGGNDTRSLLIFHEAMRKDGCLRPHIEVDMSRARNIGELLDPALKEPAFRAVLGLGPDEEFEQLGQARSLYARMQAGRTR